jgi:aminotransferase
MLNKEQTTNVDKPLNSIDPSLNMESLLNHHEAQQPWLRQVTLKVAEKGGINLSQGTCLLPTPKAVIEGANEAMMRGENRYSPADGIPRLRQAILKKLRSFNNIPCDIENVAVTTGSTGALESICSSFLEKDDEVILFDPSYPYHRNVIKRYGGIVRPIELSIPDWSFSLDDLSRAINSRTKFVLLCNPANPTGKVFSLTEQRAIGEMCIERGIFCVSDEVYEHITFDGRQHISMASIPGLSGNTITIGSFSKTFAITGWRLGYLCSPKSIFPILRAASDQVYICPPTPLQHGVANGLENLGPEYYAEQLETYHRKRDLLCGALEEAGMDVICPQGAYYVIASTAKRFPGRSSEAVAIQSLIEDQPQGRAIGAVPANDFLTEIGQIQLPESRFLRFCFAMPDDMLEAAAVILRELSQ